jgi:hypothetical protein
MTGTVRSAARMPFAEISPSRKASDTAILIAVITDAPLGTVKTRMLAGVRTRRKQLLPKAHLLTANPA